MLVPVSWLKDYVEITMPVEELAYRLTLAGLEVDQIQFIGLPADEEAARQWSIPVTTGHLVWDREKLVLGHVLEVKSHPNADRLVLAMVDSGIGEVETAVTGAPNLFPYKDQGPLDEPLVVAYAREGAEVIDGHKDDGSRMILKARSLRGIENKTMVCSEKELGISDEHEGIMILESDAAPGTPLQDVLGDAILDIELTPNLARCFSIIGVAREVAALTGQRVKYPPLDVVAEGPPIEGQVNLDIREPELNPRFTLALIKNIELKPSPEWMQRRLKLVGMRPINNIVDVTNYVMIEYGQPLHAFDYDALVERADGGVPTIITRVAEEGETLTTLDDVEHILDPFTIMVADEKGSLSLGGIMGGAETEIYDAAGQVLDATGIELDQEPGKPQHGKASTRSQSTTDVLLESANWNFINLRRTLSAQRAHGTEMVTEAGTRFSRGVHPAQARRGLLRAIELMRQLAGGEIAQGIIDGYPLPAPVVSVDLPLSEIERLIGIALDRNEVVRILESLEFTVEDLDDQTLRVTVPDHRMDIGRLNDPSEQDIADLIARADLLEEIARIYGYDRIPQTMLADEIPPQRTNVLLAREELVRDLLVNAGLQEVINYRLTSPERESLLTPPGAQSDWPDRPYIELSNPLSTDKRVMRHTLLAGILDGLAANVRWRNRQAVFEIGSVYLPVEGQILPDEPRHLCIAVTGERFVPVWQDGRKDPQVMDYYDLKGVVDTLVEGLHLEASVEACQHASFFPGRTACLRVGDTVIGTFGELHPLVREAFDLPEQPVLVADFNLELLQEHIKASATLEPISSYPAIYQDIAVIVDEAVPAAEVEAIIAKSGGFLLRDVRLFDVYRGDQIGAGKKSLAYALAFQAPDKTLKDKDANKLRQKIIKTLKKKLDARLRE